MREYCPRPFAEGGAHHAKSYGFNGLYVMLLNNLVQFGALRWDDVSNPGDAEKSPDLKAFELGETIGKSSLNFNSRSINRSYQNEGTQFTMSRDGKTIAAAGNFRTTVSGGGTGVWASDNTTGALKAEILEELSGGRGDEGHLQPDVAIDEWTCGCREGGLR